MESNMTEQQISEILLGLGYENRGLVGQGAFSRVYRVRERKTGLWFACKISREHKMLEREAHFLKQLDHPLFPKFLCETCQKGQGFLFMEYVWGVNLEALVVRRRKLSECQTVQAGAALAEGLYYLHERRIPVLFRDVKPGNIMIKQDGGIKLLDLGSAGELSAGRNVITGTPGYAAPEQLAAGSPVGFYSDVYAVGRVMYFMATGKRVYPESDESKSDKSVWNGVKLHRGVKQLIEDCIRKDAHERIPDMRCLLQGLKPYAEGQKREMRRLERKARLRGEKRGEYIFQQNIRKSFDS